MKAAIAILILSVSASFASAPPESFTNYIPRSAWSATNETTYTWAMATNALAYDIDALIKRIRDYNQTKELVKALAKQGKICEVLGHKWRGGRPGESGGFTFCDYHPGVTYRTCDICGKCESKTEEWK